MEQGREHIKGSALIAVAILVMVMGLLGIGVLYSLKSVTRETQEEQTIAKMNRIVHALSVFMQRNDRVPCPANPNRTDTNPPFGAERGSGASGTATGSCALLADEDGIVPFKTLGFSESDVKDAWGNYFTYHASQSTSLSSADALSFVAAYPNTKVHDICRVKYQWVNPSDDNWYPRQALACCSKPDESLQILDSAGNDVSGNSAVWSNADFQPIHANAPKPSINHTILPDPVALVLVSHGVNGAGAYIGSGANARKSVTGISAAELDNTDGNTGDASFRLLPRTETSSSYFDDIVRVESMSSLYAEVGNKTGGTCSFTAGCPPIPVAAAIAAGFFNAAQLPMTDMSGNPCP